MSPADHKDWAFRDMPPADRPSEAAESAENGSRWRLATAEWNDSGQIRLGFRAFPLPLERSMGLTVGLDIVEELRLRRWARENYAAADDRCVDWHPVILEEMERRDAEVDRLAGPAIVAPRFYPNRRLDGVYGPHEIRPHYELDVMVQREMHYT